MITANSKITALEILNELGIKNAESIFGTMRVRIGGISGINTAEHLINIPAEATELEVIVGAKVYDLELNKGNKENNAEIRTISDEAKTVLENEGKKATEAAEKLQAVKAVAKNIKENGDNYTPSKEEKAHFDEAMQMVENENIAKEAQVESPEADRIKVKSK